MRYRFVLKGSEGERKGIISTRSVVLLCNTHTLHVRIRSIAVHKRVSEWRGIIYITSLCSFVLFERHRQT